MLIVINLKNFLLNCVTENKNKIKKNEIRFKQQRINNSVLQNPFVKISDASISFIIVFSGNFP